MTVWFYWVLKSVLGPVLRSVFRPWVRGGENVPTTGGAILASVRSGWNIAAGVARTALAGVEPVGWGGGSDAPQATSRLDRMIHTT